MIKKRSLSFVLAIVLCFTTMLISTPITAFAVENKTYVAKVGEENYETIDEAIANWTNGKILTLLNDVTLSDAIVIKSTEHHVLDLGSYTMTAASGKNAIEITAEGVGTAAKNCLTINANSENPGGITAAGKACIYYNNAEKINDRLTVTINGGIFNGSYAINSTSGPLNKFGFCTSPLRGQGAPYYVFNGGIFNAQVNLNAAMLCVTGGTFNKNLTCMGDSTAYRLISGGRFYSMTMTADADTKFTIGSSKGVYDRYVYVDADGYVCVYSKAKISELSEESFIKTLGITAKLTGSAISKRNSYLQYSSAKTLGLYYVDSALAFNDYDKTTQSDKDVVFYEGANLPRISLNTNLEVDFANNEVLPTTEVVLAKATSTFAYTCTENTKPNITVTSGLTAYEVVETVTSVLAEETKLNYSYRLNKLPVYAKIGSAEYPSLLSAVENAQSGNVITLLDNVTEDGFVLDKDLTIDLGGFTYTIDGTVGSTGTKTNGLQLLKGVNLTIKNGTITSETAKILIQNYANLTLENVTLDGTNLAGNLPYTLSNNSGNVTIKNSKIVASENGVAFDVCNYSSYTAPIVTVENSTITGKIEMSDYNGGDFAGKIIDGNNIHTTLGNYLQINQSILPIYDYNLTLSVSDNAIQANDEIIVEVNVDKEYYSLDYTFTYDNTKFSCAQDADGDGVIEVNCLTTGTAGVLATYNLTALNDITKVTTTDLSVNGAVIQHSIQSLNDVENVVYGETERVKISLDYVAETKVDYVTGYTLVLVKGEDAGYAYDGQKTFYVTEYESYAILVEGTVTLEQIDENLSKSENCEVIVKSYDVNVEYLTDGKIDLKDATAAYACYNLNFDVNEYLELFLRADVNNDFRVDYADINTITANYTE